jgi:hypothetical protein
MSEDPFHPERGGTFVGLVGSLNVEGRVLSLVGKGATSKRALGTKLVHHAVGARCLRCPQNVPTLKVAHFSCIRSR